MGKGTCTLVHYTTYFYVANIFTYICTCECMCVLAGVCVCVCACVCMTKIDPGISPKDVTIPHFFGAKNKAKYVGMTGNDRRVIAVLV